jgi:hypothetical protein
MGTDTCLTLTDSEVLGIPLTQIFLQARQWCFAAEDGPVSIAVGSFNKAFDFTLDTSRVVSEAPWLGVARHDTGRPR